MARHIKAEVPYLGHIIKSYAKHYLKKKVLEPITDILEESEMTVNLTEYEVNQHSLQSQEAEDVYQTAQRAFSNKAELTSSRETQIKGVTKSDIRPKLQYEMPHFDASDLVDDFDEGYLKRRAESKPIEKVRSFKKNKKRTFISPPAGTLKSKSKIKERSKEKKEKSKEKKSRPKAKEDGKQEYKSNYSGSEKEVRIKHPSTTSIKVLYKKRK